MVRRYQNITDREGKELHKIVIALSKVGYNENERFNWVMRNTKQGMNKSLSVLKQLTREAKKERRMY